MPTLLYPGQQLITETGGELTVREWRGEGSYARLYRGTWLARKAERADECAVKLAKSEVEGAAARLGREREALSRGRLPRVVSLLDGGRHGAPYLVLAWIEGAPLRRVMERRRQMPLVNALALFADAAEGIAGLHDAGVTHGDLRPDNVIVLAGERRACLADLGSAILRPDPGFDATRRQDLNGLGGLLHLMLTGGLPSGGASRLTAGAGYNREAVALYEAAVGGSLGAASLAARAGALLAGLGALAGEPGRAA